jgi:hypothetical protein
MADFNAQNTDSENSKGPLKSTVRDNDLRKNGQGGLQDIARNEQPDQLTTRVEPSPTVK